MQSYRREYSCLYVAAAAASLKSLRVNELIKIPSIYHLPYGRWRDHLCGQLTPLLVGSRPWNTFDNFACADLNHLYSALIYLRDLSTDAAAQEATAVLYILAMSKLHTSEKMY